MAWNLAKYFIKRLPKASSSQVTRQFSLNRSSSSGQAKCQPERPRVCIVGSGPAGFYTAQNLLKGNDNLEIDMYEKLPAPFGLVRYGVAPDHPETKNVINTFTNIAKQGRVHFYGNVSVGQDVTLAQLRQAYHVVVLAYGAAQDRWLGIPGETLPSVVSARRFVGWYNGLPEDADLKVDFNTDAAVIIGQGNVALDVARILLTPLDILRKTDITEYALHALSESRIRRVHIVGRRGPLQVAFTIKELREMVNLPGARPLIHLQDLAPIEPVITSLPRPRRRLTDLMLQTAKSSPQPADREWELQFRLNPLRINEDEGSPGRIASVTFAVNKLSDETLDNPDVLPTGVEEQVSCGLVFRSIGYRSVPLSSELPFDPVRGTIRQKLGRVESLPGVYCSGWLASGPVGVIASTLQSGIDVAKVILEDLYSGNLPGTSEARKGSQEILQTLQEKGVTPVSFSQWEQLDREEMRRGSTSGKPREKISDVGEMLSIAKQNNDC